MLQVPQLWKQFGLQLNVFDYDQLQEKAIEFSVAFFVEKRFENREIIRINYFAHR